MTEYERIVQAVREHGERMTIQRQMVIEAVTSTGAHMTIQDISAAIRSRHNGQSLPEPTIYRILQRLKELELISQTDMAESGIVYQVIHAPRHHHLICLRCGVTQEVPDSLFDPLRRQLKADYQFQARIDHMAIYGYCAACAGHHDANG
ncbi:MAG: transcriptional repressor [Chloroflexi bacterium]|nr:transcriptional repressor [Chloroflexota bacterium]